MSPQIGEEVQLLLISVYSGLILVFCYDFIRIFRRVFYASIVRSIIEDIIFWTVAAIYLFNIFLKYNYGSPRYYGVGATAVTMILFEWLIGRRLIDWIAKKIRRILGFLLKPLKKLLNGFKLIVHRSFQKMRRLLHSGKKGESMTSDNRLRGGITRDSSSGRTVSRETITLSANNENKRRSSTRRLDQIRKRRQKNRRMILSIMIVAFLFCVVIGVQMIQKYRTLKELREQESKLQEQYQAELDLSQELKDKEAYVQTDEYVEEMARRLGLLYPNEIIFKADK